MIVVYNEEKTRCRGEFEADLSLYLIKKIAKQY